MFAIQFKFGHFILLLFWNCVCVKAIAGSMQPISALNDADFDHNEYANINTDVDNPSTRIDEINDSRLDGISYEANRATCSQYLQYTFSSEHLDDFSKPGFHRILLVYEDIMTASRGDKLLQCICDVGFHKDSSWEIEINGEAHANERPLFNLTLLHEFFSAVPNITVLRWNAGFPTPRNILDVLEQQHPTCHLYYSSLFDYRYIPLGRPQDRDRQIELRKSTEADRRTASQSILNSTVLYSLTTGIHYGGDSETERMGLLHKILTTCPNIRELILSVGHSGCTFSAGPQPHGFNFQDNKGLLPPLKSLALNGYNFEGKPNGEQWMEWEADKPRDSILYFPWSWLPTSIIDKVGYAKILDWGGLQSYYVKRDSSPLKVGEKTNLDYWLEVMDWTKLHTLKLSYPSAYELEKLSNTTLPSLKNITFDGGDRTAITKFLSNTTSSLESISIKNDCVCPPDDILNAIYPSHNKTLKSLFLNRGQTHQEPGGYYFAQRAYKTYHYPLKAFLNKTHLSQLLTTFLDLQILDIDLYLDKNWDYELLDTITSFPELTELTLRIEGFMPPKGPKSWERRVYEYLDVGEHYVDENDEKERMIVVGLGAYLRKVKKGREFEVLRIIVDEREIKNSL